MNFKNTRLNSSEQELKWRFKWADDSALFELFGTNRGFEVKAQVPPEFADDYASQDQSNFPFGASAYRDTPFSNQGPLENFGVGATYAAPFVSGVNYWASVDVDTGTQSGLFRPFRVDFVAASKMGTPCWPTNSFCVFPDYFLRYFNDQDYLSPNNASRSQHAYLHNWADFGFENNGAGWAVSSGSIISYPTGTYPYYAVDGSKYVKFRRPAGTSTIWSDTNYGADPTDSFTVTAMVRCLPSSSYSDCRGEIGYKTTAGLSFENDTYIQIPDNGRWYVCRVDWDHGGIPAWPTNGGSKVRVFVRNYRTNQYLHVDDFRLGGYTNNVTSTQGDPGPTAYVGPTCTQDSVNDG